MTQVGRGMDEAVARLDSFRSSPIEFGVPIDEDIFIDAEIALDRTLTVPIRTMFPIDGVVETTITIDWPFDTQTSRLPLTWPEPSLFRWPRGSPGVGPRFATSWPVSSENP